MRLEETNGAEKPKAEEALPQAEMEIKPQPPIKTEKPKSSAFQSLLTKIGFSLLFLVVGALAVALALYLPAASKLNKAQAEVERLTAVETEYIALQDDFAKANRKAVVYKTISDTSLLEAALAGSDTTKATQQLRYVEDDLAALETVMETPEVMQRLQSQFTKVRSSAGGNSQTALAELNKFYTDLLLLASNLE